MFFFIDFCAAVITPLFWLLHPRAFSTWACRYKHGGNEQQYEKRSCMYTDRLHVVWLVVAYLWYYWYQIVSGFFFCLKESLCGQRGLLPNTEVQTFQVSLTNRLRLQYDRIREPLSRVCAFCVAFVIKLWIKRKIIQFKYLLMSSAPEERAFAVDWCMLG